MKHTVYIYDFDYTLGDCTDAIVESMTYAFNQQGIIVPAREDIRRTVGKTLRESFNILTGDANPDNATRFNDDFMLRADEVMAQTTVLYPDTLTTLQTQKSAGCKIAIVTTKLHRRITDILTRFDATELVDIIIGSDDVIEKKPAPEGVFKVLAHLAAEPSDVLYIGDTTVDAETAKSAGVAFAAVTTGTTTRMEFAPYGCAVYENLAQMLKAEQRIAKLPPEDRRDAQSAWRTPRKR